MVVGCSREPGAYEQNRMQTERMIEQEHQYRLANTPGYRASAHNHIAAIESGHYKPGLASVQDEQLAQTACAVYDVQGSDHLTYRVHVITTRQSHT